MSWSDTESTTTADDSGLKNALGVIGHTIARHDLEAKVVAGAAAFVAIGLLVRLAYTSQFGDNMGAIIVWFTLIFVAGFAVLGACIKLWSVLQRQWNERE